ncbi:hypothetical protein BN2156_03111 [Mycolicibacterium neworleansense]|uniref:Uncharacterized protein n=1 Tax=Mycolicibacterium neworleansense TaxID=146018 RepID=A0A0H5S506_9MYCO|nr:hypothetical protein BN2156_03111 [Mycolicibacterium neworleansense]
MRTVGLEPSLWIVDEQLIDSGRAKLAKTGKQQIAIAEL